MHCYHPSNPPQAMCPVCHVVLNHCVAQTRSFQVAVNQVQFCSGSISQICMAIVTI